MLDKAIKKAITVLLLSLALVAGGMTVTGCVAEDESIQFGANEGGGGIPQLGSGNGDASSADATSGDAESGEDAACSDDTCDEEPEADAN